MKYCFQFNYTYDILTIMTKVKQMKNNSLNESKKKVRNLVAKTKQWNLIDRRKNSSQERFEDGQYFIIIILSVNKRKATLITVFTPFSIFISTILAFQMYSPLCP